MAHHEEMSKRIMSMHAMDNAAFWMAKKSNQELGRLGEMYVTHWFKSQGIEATDTAHLRRVGDVSVMTKTGETIHFEVKTAKRDMQGNYQFCLRKAGKTDISHSEYVVLLAVDDYGKIYRYIVPRAVFGKRRKCAISSHPTEYTGKLSPYLIKAGQANLQSILLTYQYFGVKA